jgi:hypothetical protein
MAKANSIIIKMVSTGLKKDGKTKTGYFKTTKKNPKGEKKEKIKKKCFDPRAWNEEKGRFGKHVLFEESKIK